MKLRGITNLQQAGWMLSGFVVAWSALAADGADAVPVDAAKVEGTTGEKVQGSSAPGAPLSPVGDFVLPAPPADGPISDLSDKGLRKNVPDTLPVIIPTGKPVTVIAPKAAEEGDSVASGPAKKDPEPLWQTAPGGFPGRLGSGFGNDGPPSAPSGFTSMAPSFPIGGRATGVFEGFSLSSTFSTTYDSNTNLSSNSNSGSGGSSKEPQDDLIFALGGGLGYMSKAREWTFGGNYSGSYSEYTNQPDHSGYNQGFGLVGRYNGGDFTASLNLSGGVEKGTNRYYSYDFVQETNINAGLSLSYQLSPKTSFQGNYGQTFTVAGGNKYSNTDSFNLGLSAFWKYSELTQLGSGVRYSFQSSGNQNARTSISPLFFLNYKLAAKVSLNSSVGMDFSQYEDGGSADPSLTGSIGLAYNASQLWGMNLSLFTGTQPNPSSAGTYTQASSMRLGYHRKLRQASLNLGIGYTIDSTQASGNASTSKSPDRNSLSMDASLGMPVFANTCQASISLRTSNEGGVTEQNSTQARISISHSF